MCGLLQEVASASALAIAEVVGACQASDANSAGCARGDAEVEVIAKARPGPGPPLLELVVLYACDSFDDIVTNFCRMQCAC